MWIVALKLCYPKIVWNMLKGKNQHRVGAGDWNEIFKRCVRMGTGTWAPEQRKTMDLEWLLFRFPLPYASSLSLTYTQNKNKVQILSSIYKEGKAHSWNLYPFLYFSLLCFCCQVEAVPRAFQNGPKQKRECILSSHSLCINFYIFFFFWNSIFK